MLRAMYLFFPFFSSKRKYPNFKPYSRSLFNLLLSICNSFAQWLYDTRLRSDERNKSLIFRSKQKASKRFLSLRANFASSIPILILFIIIYKVKNQTDERCYLSFRLACISNPLTCVDWVYMILFFAWKIALSFHAAKLIRII